MKSVREASSTMRQSVGDRLQRDLNNAKKDDEQALEDTKEVISELMTFIKMISEGSIVAYGYEIAYLEALSGAISGTYQKLKQIAGHERLAIWGWEEKRDQLRAAAYQALRDRWEETERERIRKEMEYEKF